MPKRVSRIVVVLLVASLMAAPGRAASLSENPLLPVVASLETNRIQQEALAAAEVASPLEPLHQPPRLQWIETVKDLKGSEGPGAQAQISPSGSSASGLIRSAVRRLSHRPKAGDEIYEEITLKSVADVEGFDDVLNMGIGMNKFGGPNYVVTTYYKGGKDIAGLWVGDRLGIRYQVTLVTPRREGRVALHVEGTVTRLNDNQQALEFRVDLEPMPTEEEIRSTLVGKDPAIIEQVLRLQRWRPRSLEEIPDVYSFLLRDAETVGRIYEVVFGHDPGAFWDDIEDMEQRIHSLHKQHYRDRHWYRLWSDEEIIRWYEFVKQKRMGGLEKWVPPIPPFNELQFGQDDVSRFWWELVRTACHGGQMMLIYEEIFPFYMSYLDGLLPLGAGLKDLGPEAADFSKEMIEVVMNVFRDLRDYAIRIREQQPVLTATQLTEWVQRAERHDWQWIKLRLRQGRRNDFHDWTIWDSVSRMMSTLGQAGMRITLLGITFDGITGAISGTNLPHDMQGLGEMILDVFKRYSIAAVSGQIPVLFNFRGKLLSCAA